EVPQAEQAWTSGVALAASPAAEGELAEQGDGAEEEQAEEGGGEDRGEQVGGLQAARGLEDDRAEAELVAKSGEELADDRADDGEAGADLGAGDEVGHGPRQPQLEEDLQAR